MDDPFDLVRQFDSMRQTLGSQPQQMQPQAAQQPQSDVARRYQSPNLDGISAAPSQGGGGLVDFNGIKINRRLMPYAQALSGMNLRPTSGWRDPEHNARVNGVQNSWHLRGAEADDEHGAMDFAGSAGDMQRGAAWARANGAREVLIHNAGSGQHLHVAW